VGNGVGVSMSLKRLAQGILVLAILAAVGWSTYARLTVHRPAGLLLVSGRIEGDEVSLGAKMAGRVIRLYADEGDRVEPNQLVAELDSEEFTAMLDYTRAEAVAAQKQIAQITSKHAQAMERVKQAEIALKLSRETTVQNIKLRQAGVAQADATLKQVRAQLDNAQYELGRLSGLSEKEVAAQVELRRARDLTRGAEAQVEATESARAQAAAGLELAHAQEKEVLLREAELATAKEMVVEAERGIEQARAKLDSSMAAERAARANLNETKIRSPSAGVVLTRVVEPGEVVDSGGVLYVIVNPDRLHLKGYVQELSMGQVKVGQPARVYIDARPDQPFEARVKRINEQAEFTPKTIETTQQRVKLVFGIELAVDNAERFLKPGLPADGVIRLVPEAPWALPSQLR
jgi:HlyD family secretion protein